jgi:hypothetical protein
MSFISNVLSSGLKTNPTLNAQRAAGILQEWVCCSTYTICQLINKSLFETNLAYRSFE